MLRVDGLKVSLRTKQEEVRDANKRAADILNVAQYHCIINEIATKSREMKQEELIKEHTTSVETTNKKLSDLQLQVQNL